MRKMAQSRFSSWMHFNNNGLPTAKSSKRLDDRIEGATNRLVGIVYQITLNQVGHWPPKNAENTSTVHISQVKLSFAYAGGLRFGNNVCGYNHLKCSQNHDQDKKTWHL